MAGVWPTAEQTPFIPVHCLLWRLPCRLPGTSLPLTLPGLWHDLCRGAAACVLSEPPDTEQTLLHNRCVFSSYLILLGSMPAPTLPPEAATFCSMDYPPMSTEVCPRPPHSGMISQETTDRKSVV